MTAAATARSAEDRDLEGVDAFDFLYGRWTVGHQRLKQRNAGCREWDLFTSPQLCEPRLGGVANIDELDMAERGFAGMSLRLFDVEAREWAVYWVNSRDGKLQPPVRGRFEGPRCVLTGPDTDDGRPIIARYIWSRTDTPTPRWEQAFSYDGGETWETNWIMDLERPVG